MTTINIDINNLIIAYGSYGYCNTTFAGALGAGALGRGAVAGYCSSDRAGSV